MHFLSPIETFKRNPLTHHSSPRFSQALELLFMNPDLSNPDVFSFSAAISACEKVGNWQRALHLLYFMSSRRVPGWLQVVDFLRLHYWRVIFEDGVTFSQGGIYWFTGQYFHWNIWFYIPFEVISILDPCCFICWKLLLCKRTSSLLTHKYQVYTPEV